MLQALSLYYWLPFTAAWCLLTWMLMRRPGVSARTIIVVALAARLIVVFATTPALSDDIWRYIHDGRTLGGGVQPYAQSPAEVGGDERINHPHMVTIYQPASQWVFAAAAMVADVAAPPEAAHVVFRLVFVAFDMAVVLLLLRALRDRGRSAWWAALYAWHPLAISEVAGSGHQEPVGIALLLAALLLAERAGDAGAALGGAAFAAAVAVKPLVLPLALPLAWALRDRRGALTCAMLAAAAMGAALYVPMALWQPGLGRMHETVTVFMRDWAFNSSVHGLLAHLAGSKPPADYAAGAALLVVLAVCLRKGYEPTRAAMVYLFAALLLSSTAHPWYMLWALALLPLHFNVALWVWSLTVAASYAVLRDRAAWRLPVWVVWCEYVPVYALLLRSIILARRRSG